VNDGADVLTFGRDPDQPSWWQGHRRLAAATAAVALIGAGVAVGLRAGDLKPPTTARQSQSVATMLSGVPFRPDGRLGPLLLGGPAGVRLLKVGGGVSGAVDWVHDLRVVIASTVLGPNATVAEIASASGGVVALLGNDPTIGDSAAGYVLFIPVTSRGAGVPRVIAEANYLAVAPNQRDIWVEQLTAQPDHDSRAWLVSESGRRLSAILHVHNQDLLAATVAGLLLQGPSGEGASLVSPTTGIARPAGLPPDGLVLAAGADDVAWMAASCADACPLHITSLRDGVDTVIPLPPRTLPSAYFPLPAAFDLAGQHLALAMEITNREDRITGTSVYVADISLRRLIQLPGGPIPLSASPTHVGAMPHESPDVVSVHWAGSGLWIVATNGEESQAAYWAGGGPLRVIAPMPGAAYTFSGAAG
jgi:hypothetical protein